MPPVPIKDPSERIWKVDRRASGGLWGMSQCQAMASTPRPVRQYPSDVTDDEWALLEPHLPAPKNTGPAGGRPSSAPLRVIVNTLSCTCCERDARGVSRRLTSRPGRPATATSSTGAPTAKWTGCMSCCGSGCARWRAAMSRRPRASSTPMTVRGAATVGAQSRGFDAGKKTNGRKRHRGS